MAIRPFAQKMVLPAPMWRTHPILMWAVSGVLAGVFIASFLTYLATTIVSNDLLDPTFYTAALDETRIYDRVYSDLLADPALRDVTEDLIGNLNIARADSRAAYSYTVSTARLVLPPPVLRLAIERAIEELIDYLSGDTAQWNGDLHLARAIHDPDLQEKMISGAQNLQSELITLARAEGLLTEQEAVRASVDPQELYAELERYVRLLAVGQVDEVPLDIVNARLESLSDTDKSRIAGILLGPVATRVPDPVRLQIENALLENNLEGALVMASGELVSLRAEAAAESLKKELDHGTWDGLRSFALLADKTKFEIVAELNDTRTLVAYTRNELMPLMASVMVLSLLGLVWIQSRRSRSVLMTVGVMLVLAGAASLVAGLVVEHVVYMPYESYTVQGVGSQQLPASLRLMLQDFLNALAGQLRASAWARGSIALVIGSSLIVLALTPALVNHGWWVWEWANRHRVLATVAAIVLLVAGTALLIPAIQGGHPARARELVCNGHVELCDRPLCEVTFAATHNAMSAASKGWIWPNQDIGITAQLQAGVRALLIDAHYGDTPEEINQYLAALPEVTRPFAQRIIYAADPALRGEGTFLCHNLCSLGGTPLENGLREIRRFLDDNPHEVIVLLIQDEIAVEDAVQAFEDSGLVKYVYTHPPGDKWPTLGELVLRDERLVVMAEYGGSPPAWYHHMWDLVEETPYAFASLTDMSCVPNRGDSDKSLFLLNHWIVKQSPDRVDAARVNEFWFLMSRVRRCEDERGRLPTFIAVDFFSVGDVFAVVDALNEVD